MIQIQDLHVTYPNGAQALRGVDVRVGAGEFLTVIGPSGAGKSTLLRCINGLVQPMRGSVSVCGEDVRGLTRKELLGLRRNVGMIFQQNNLINRASVLHNVLIGRLGYISAWRSCLFSIFYAYGLVDRFIALENLKKVGMEEFALHRVHSLSGGQQQRVAIARMLTQAPDIVLADEPVANLDPRLAREFLSLLKSNAARHRIAVVMSIHSLELVRDFADRVVAIVNGRVVADTHVDRLDGALVRQIYEISDPAPGAGVTKKEVSVERAD